jgi:hypothetical protein
MAANRQEHPEPKQVKFSFQHTDAWEQVLCRIDRRPLDHSPGSDTFEANAVLVELQLQGDRYRLQALQATKRALALEFSRQEGLQVDKATLTRTIDQFRISKDLLTPESMEQWLSDQELGLAEFERLMREQARVNRVEAIFAGDLGRLLPAHLRLSGEYAALDARARDKQRVLAARGLDNPGLSDAGMDEHQLWQWYFEQHLERQAPSDLPAYARSIGFGNEHEMQRAVLRELCYLRLSEEANHAE